MDIDLRSIKRHRAGTLIRFVLAGDLGGRVPEEDELREIARWVTSELAPTGNEATAGQWVLSTQGWAGWLLGWRDMDDAEEWLNRFASSFTGGGDARIIGGPRSSRRQQLDTRPTLASFLYLTTSDMRLVPRNDHGPFWGVDDTTTAYVCEQMAYWVHQTRATEWVCTNTEDSFETKHLTDHAKSMAEMVTVMRQLRVESAVRDPLRYRTADLQPHGLVDLRVVDPTTDWRAKVDQVQQLLTWSPPRSDYGYVRQHYGNSIVYDLGLSWPHTSEVHVRYNRPLLKSFVPDVFGIQLLTDAHLERARDLSGWDIRPLGGGRHLVSARNLEAWFTPKPGAEGTQWDPEGLALLPQDLDLVSQARHDFGDMILTPEAIEEHNPWA